MSVRLHWLALLVGVFLLMVGIGSLPGEAHAMSDRFGDKLLHLLAYGFMTVLCFRALIARPRSRALLSVLAIALLGVIDEYLQSLLPYRNASIVDWCFDVVAAAAVAALLLWLDTPSLSTESHAKN
jgi:VanZ family protein